MSPSHLTPKQKRVFDYIRDFTEAQGYAPSQQEIAARFGFRSLGTVQNYLVRLEEQGFLRRSWNAKRALEVVDRGSASPDVPLVGRVAAGRPIEAVAQDERLEVPSWTLGKGEHFALLVKGNSMVGDGILDGDYIVVRRQADAANGQTVVALVDGEATVKRFFRRADGIELQPANPTMTPIRVEPGQDFLIHGLVVAVIRRCA
jgi:repressor LexA